MEILSRTQVEDQILVAQYDEEKGEVHLAQYPEEMKGKAKHDRVDDYIILSLEQLRKVNRSLKGRKVSLV